MSGSSAPPLHVHVSKRTPVHVYVQEKSRKGAVRPSGAEGRKSKRPEKPAPVVKKVVRRKPIPRPTPKHWIHAPAKASRPKLAWEGPTHRLEIHAPTATNQELVPEGETELRMSDLGSEEREGKVEKSQEAGASALDRNGVEEKIKALQSEVDSLRTNINGELLQLQPSLTGSRVQGPGEVSISRDQLLSKLVEVEMESSAISRQVGKLQESVERLEPEKTATDLELAEQKSELQRRVMNFKRRSRSLLKLLRSQTTSEASLPPPPPPSFPPPAPSSSLVQSTIQPPQLALHTQRLHDELERKEVELQSLMIHSQSLEEQLSKRDQECAKLEAGLQKVRRKTRLEKEALKRAAVQHKSRAGSSQQIVEVLDQQLEEARSELETVRVQLTQTNAERVADQSELSTLHTRVKELEELLTRSKAESQSTLNQVQDALKSVEMTSNSRLVQAHKECDDLKRQLRQKELELERQQQEGALHLERSQAQFKQQLATLEPLPELLRVSEQNLHDSQNKLAECERRMAEQLQLVEELTAKMAEYGQQVQSLENMREKWSETVTENQSLLAKLDVSERNVQESDQQSRELVAITTQKEETIQKLQTQLEQAQQSLSSLHSQMGVAQSESQRQLERKRTEAARKERASASRAADLEAQLSRANHRISQMTRSKEEAERKHHSKVREIQSKLDRVTNSLRSLESYVSILKSSYSSVYDTRNRPEPQH